LIIAYRLISFGYKLTLKDERSGEGKFARTIGRKGRRADAIQTYAPSREHQPPL
jgi:predicted RNA-binding protein YlqC (UPF0109 family)